MTHPLETHFMWGALSPEESVGGRTPAPCPFCMTPNPRLFNRLVNGEKYLDWDSYGYQCVSSECGICGPERGTEEEALEAWNRRVHHDTPTTPESCGRPAISEQNAEREGGRS